jgi:hypothetical protein
VSLRLFLWLVYDTYRYEYRPYMQHSMCAHYPIPFLVLPVQTSTMAPRTSSALLTRSRSLLSRCVVAWRLSRYGIVRYHRQSIKAFVRSNSLSSSSSLLPSVLISVSVSVSHSQSCYLRRIHASFQPLARSFSNRDAWRVKSRL